MKSIHTINSSRAKSIIFRASFLPTLHESYLGALEGGVAAYKYDKVVNLSQVIDITFTP